MEKARRYLEAGIRTSRGLGKGRGPINHFLGEGVEGVSSLVVETVEWERGRGIGD